ncbi:MAG: DUF2550 family protein [Propionibacteriaceae bacterium]|nr:DUF2550 family protein [Propionibacteriaceae bacterium]
MDWGDLLVPIIGLVIVCALLVLSWPLIRRLLLARHGSIFDCELNLGGPAEPRWELGMARCSGDDLDWFPRHGVGLSPEHTLSRQASGIRAQTRSTDPDVLSGHRIVRLEPSVPGAQEAWELALDTDALTALLAWLEAAPPSVGRFTS